jgi:8-oxo-dGTP pyrophosphatase MutT (NUDIX family)
MSLWHPVDKKLTFRSMLFHIFHITFKSEKTGKTGNFEVIETRDWTNIIPVTTDGQFLMVKQFRFGSSELSLEFPAGVIEPNEDPQKASLRELQEETGGIAKTIFFLGSCKPNPAFLKNSMHHYLAQDVEIIHEQSLDHFEEIEVIKLSFQDVETKIKNGEITHSLSLTAWYFYLQFLKDKVR